MRPELRDLKPQVLRLNCAGAFLLSSDAPLIDCDFPKQVHWLDSMIRRRITTSLSDDFTCGRLGLQWRFFEPAQQPVAGRRHRLRVTYRRHLITCHHAADDGPRTRRPWLKDVSELHQSAPGDVRPQRFTYRPLPA